MLKWHTMQAYVLNVSSIFQTYVESVFIQMFVYVSHICCKCFIWMLHMFAMANTHVFSQCFKHMLQVFQLFRTYVASVSSKCYKLDLVLHILQLDPSAITACCSYWARLHARGCGGGTSDRHGKPCERKSRCGPCMGARRRGKWSGAGPRVKLAAQTWGLAQQLACLCRGADRRSRRGRLDASARSDVQALA